MTKTPESSLANGTVDTRHISVTKRKWWARGMHSVEAQGRASTVDHTSAGDGAVTGAGQKTKLET